MAMNTTSVNSSERVYGATGSVSPVNTFPAHNLNIFKGLWKILVTWQQRIAYRQHLLELDERLLRDIGISRYDALKEAAKPFWKD
jgi:uncharacterized protein YjiS (DUF1127 family)